MVTRLVNLAGLHLGQEDELFAGREDNPDGFWEHKRFFEINVAVLEALGGSWDVPPTPPQGWEDDPKLAQHYDEARALVAEFEATGLPWGWKDPRSSLTLKFWQKVVPGLKVIIPVRNPIDVCNSLTKRGYASQKFGFDLWTAYMAAIESAVPAENLLYTHYSAYFLDPVAELRRVAAFCGLTPTQQQLDEAVKAVKIDLRHSDRGFYELVASKADEQLIQHYFASCVAAGPVSMRAFRESSLTIAQSEDRVREKDREIGFLQAEMRAKEESLMAVIHRNLEEANARMQEMLAVKDKALREESERSWELGTALQGANDRASEHARQLTEYARGLQTQLEAHVHKIARLEAELADLRGSQAYRLGTKISRAINAVLPPGSTPRRAIGAAKRVATGQSLRPGGSARTEPTAQTAKAVKPLKRKKDPVALVEQLVWESNERAARLALQAEAVREAALATPQARFGRALAPPGSTRERIVNLLLRARHYARREGVARTVSKTLSYVGRKLAGMSPAPPTQAEAPAIQPASEPVALHAPEELAKDIRKELLVAKETKHVLGQYHVQLSAMLEKGHKHGPNWVDLDPDAKPLENPPVKVFAFYLTQFHPIPENDEWWGRGFTEWTNVSKAIPQFAGHYQPHLPGELGFYDLRVREVQERQVELARMHGIHGFAFYYYWFNGRRLLEGPLDAFLNNPNIDFPFCLIWANENWTRRWDGREDDMLMAQDHSPESDMRFIEDLRPFLEHPNYLRIEGRPFIGVYRPDQLPDPVGTARRWREYCLQHDLGDPIITAAQTFYFEDPGPSGFDAAMQFPPHNEHHKLEFRLNAEKWRIRRFTDEYKGVVYSYPALVGYKHGEDPKPHYRLFETAFPMWDNAARLPLTGVTYAFSSPELYKIWLQRLCTRAVEREKNPESRVVFINAWNEWAEGAHLEPDRRYGYAYLRATREALEFTQRVAEGSATPANIQLKPDPEIEQLTSDKPHKPIFVFQMGKVGSISIHDALVEMNLGEPVFHLHLLNNIDQISANVCKRYPTPEGTLFYLRRGQIVRDWMATADESAIWNVITGVREPVGRNVSAFFEMLHHLVPNIEARFAADDITVEELQELFLHLYDQRSPNLWFDGQFKPVFGIDVYAKPFPHAQGYDLYEEGNSRALLIRVEDLSACVGQAMERFLGIKDFQVQTKNTSDAKAFGELARRFKEVPLPEAYVEQMCATRYARHFYSEQELDRAFRQWTGGA